MPELLLLPLSQGSKAGRKGLEELLQEAALLGRLSHANVVRLHGACLRSAQSGSCRYLASYYKCQPFCVIYIGPAGGFCGGAFPLRPGYFPPPCALIL